MRMAAIVRRTKAFLLRKPLTLHLFCCEVSMCKGSWDDFMSWASVTSALFSFDALVALGAIFFIISPKVQDKTAKQWYASLKQPPEAVWRCEWRKMWKRCWQTSKTQHSQDRGRSVDTGSSNSLKFNFAQSPLRKKGRHEAEPFKAGAVPDSSLFSSRTGSVQSRNILLKTRFLSPLCPLGLLETCYHLIENHPCRKLAAKAMLLFHLSGRFCDFSGWPQGSSSKTNTLGKQRGCVTGSVESWRRTACVTADKKLK